MRETLLLLLLTPLLLWSQRDEKPISEEIELSVSVTDYTRPYTGSGLAIATDSYAVFQRSAKDDSREVRKKRRTMEQAIYKKRHRNEEARYSFDVVFHNLSGIPSEQFEKEVSLQLESLNRDFNSKPRLSKNHPHQDKIAVAGFRFNLASEGIVNKREAFNWMDWESIKSEASRGSSTKPTEQYINVWVTDIPNSIGSYAQYPEGPTETDGIVIDVDFFGSGSGIYTEGKTLTTLLAQYFGLQLLSSSDGCKDDRVDDTTVHAISYRYNLPPDITSYCDNQPLMTDNYMSHAPDAHRQYFTRGQVERMKLMIDMAPSRISLNHAKKSVQ